MKFNRDTKDSKSAVNLNSNDPIYASNSPRNFKPIDLAYLSAFTSKASPAASAPASFIYNFLDSLSLDATSRDNFSPIFLATLILRGLFRSDTYSLRIFLSFVRHSNVNFSIPCLPQFLRHCEIVVDRLRYVYRVPSPFHD